MSNVSLIARMHQLLDRYESASIGVLEFEEAFGHCMSALEGLRGLWIDRARTLCARLVSAVDPDDYEAQFGFEFHKDVVLEIRRFIDEIPCD